MRRKKNRAVGLEWKEIHSLGTTAGGKEVFHYMAVNFLSFFPLLSFEAPKKAVGKNKLSDRFIYGWLVHTRCPVISWCGSHWRNKGGDFEELGKLQAVLVVKSKDVLKAQMWWRFPSLTTKKTGSRELNLQIIPYACRPQKDCWVDFWSRFDVLSSWRPNCNCCIVTRVNVMELRLGIEGRYSRHGFGGKKKAHSILNFVSWETSWMLV